MKHEAMQNLIAAIRCVADGKTYVSPQMSERILARVSGQRSSAGAAGPVDRLTDREREVFGLIGRGLGTREIAQALKLVDQRPWRPTTPASRKNSDWPTAMN